MELLINRLDTSTRYDCSNKEARRFGGGGEHVANISIDLAVSTCHRLQGHLTSGFDSVPSVLFKAPEIAMLCSSKGT
ncbi:unnamed protein product [Nezara viridula]|uniref:Uncharacterized protein n=1 Tax=Nezara viridula TaxID=85310 RepID=A0A9P0HJ13_NEZVI|nr:unnamed protein product [Nezara viridula]